MDHGDAGAPFEDLGERAADDLTRIRRVSQQAARRLRRAGVLTYADVASRSAGELATAAGLQPERVEREDWVGQAHELTAGSPTPGPVEPGPPVEDRPGHQAFVFNLLLDQDNRVLRTTARHVRSNDEQAWAGWETGQLLAFVGRHVRLPDAAPEPAPPEVPVAPVEAAAPAPRPVTIRLSGLEVVTPESQPAGGTLRAGEPFAVQLEVGPVAAEATAPGPVQVIVTVIATALDGSVQVTLGEYRVEPSATRPAAVVIGCTGLPPGFYRVTVIGRVGYPAGRPGRLVQLDGPVLAIS